VSDIRVRFAPSPTGFVHVGSLRTALYNFLFARHNGGKFVLRVEDTDQARFTEGAVDNLLDTLNWSGLKYDEGPEIDGDYGPYFQSQRLDIYKSHIEQLIDKNFAYPCFCSEERLDKMREKQISRKMTPKYDGNCRRLDLKESLSRRENEKHVLRLKVPENGVTVVSDIIRGEVQFQNDMIDDQVLMKSDGFPTYHLANVVDDHLMQITHVIRGEEWLISTPKHIILYNYFDWPIPKFAHLPLLLNPDRSKLSKRQGDVAVEDYRKKGYLPEALINFVALLGWNRGDDEEIFSLEDLIKDFSLERVNKSGAVFNIEKLNWMNGLYIRQLSEDKFIELALDAMKNEGLDSGSRATNIQIALAVRKNIDTFNGIKDRTELFFMDGPLKFDKSALEWVTLDSSKKVFSSMVVEIEKQAEITLDSFKIIMGNVQKETGLKGKEIWMPVRSALTGMTEGPELPHVIQIFGKEKILKLLDQAIKT
jgi:glutamyl-tRNA synthetase